MKSLVALLVFCSSLLAQAPAHRRTVHHAARPSLLNPASLRARAPAEFRAEFITTKGNFMVDVHRDWAPLGADRFYNLVKNGFFTNASFFRVVPGFVVQFGLNANPAINKVWENAKITDDPVRHGNERGTIVFATAGPNTRTTQLFINYGNNAFLDNMGFAAFGTVTDGMDTAVDKIYSGYREQPDQGKITAEGDAYLTKNFPMIDKIKSAKILPAAPAAPAAAAPAAKK